MVEKQKTTLRLLFSPYPALVESKKEAMCRSIKGLIKEERFADAVSFNTITVILSSESTVILL